MKRATFVCVLLFAVVAVGKPPNILLLVSDDQRSDTIHAHGNEIIRTPNFDRLAAAGSSFMRATCACPICTPSRAEILTGCSGYRSGVLNFGKPIDSSLPTMAGWFTEAGYRAAYVGKWHNDGRPVERGYSFTRGLYRGGGGKYWTPKFDYAGRPMTGYRGWIFQDDEGRMFPDKGVGLTPAISQLFADAAISIIAEDDDSPFFLHVNFTAPHDPLVLPPGWETAYSPEDMALPENFLPQHPFDHGNFDGRDEKLFRWPRTAAETKREIAAYYAVISHMDEQIGRILDALKQSGKANDTIVVFTSDHGLAVGSHGLRGKQSMYEHTIGVPLLMAGPDIPKNRRYEAQCYLRDIFPTLCDLAGIDGPGKRIDGKSLAPVLRGERNEVYDFVVGYFRDVQRMIRTSEWKYIEYPAAGRQQLFHLRTDPQERRNLAARDTHGNIQTELRERMRRWFREQNDPIYAQ